MPGTIRSVIVSRVRSQRRTGACYSHERASGRGPARNDEMADKTHLVPPSPSILGDAAARSGKHYSDTGTDHSSLRPPSHPLRQTNGGGYIATLPQGHQRGSWSPIRSSGRGGTIERRDGRSLTHSEALRGNGNPELAQGGIEDTAEAHRTRITDPSPFLGDSDGSVILIVCVRMIDGGFHHHVGGRYQTRKENEQTWFGRCRCP